MLSHRSQALLYFSTIFASVWIPFIDFFFFFFCILSILILSPLTDRHLKQSIWILLIKLQNSPQKRKKRRRKRRGKKREERRKGGRGEGRRLDRYWLSHTVSFVINHCTLPSVAFLFGLVTLFSLFAKWVLQQPGHRLLYSDFWCGQEHWDFQKTLVLTDSGLWLFIMLISRAVFCHIDGPPVL